LSVVQELPHIEETCRVIKSLSLHEVHGTLHILLHLLLIFSSGVESSLSRSGHFVVYVKSAVVLCNEEVVVARELLCLLCKAAVTAMAFVKTWQRVRVCPQYRIKPLQLWKQVGIHLVEFGCHDSFHLFP
jgi:hypothetical protein